MRFLKLRSLFRRAVVEQEMDDELRYHIEELTEQLRRRGMSHADAHTEAMRAIGGLERRREEIRETRRVNHIENFLADVKYAVRRLVRTPGFTIVSIITLALGLGANTAIFTVVNRVLLRPLAYQDPDRLVVPNGTVAAGDYLDWRAHNRTFDGIGAAEWWSPTLYGNDRPEQITALHVTSDIFDVLGVPPLLGRVPRADEEHDGANRVVVLGYNSWQKRFHGDSGVIGRTMSFDGIAYSVIGVMPPSFHFAPYWATSAELWSPLVLEHRTTDRSGSSLRVFGRVKDGVSTAQARADLASIVTGVDDAHSAWAKRLALVPLRSMVVEDVDSQLRILQAAVVILLLIACANVAHLQLMRAAAGERESAVRLALGASSGRVVQQSMIESAVLCVTGAAIGLALGYAAVRMFVRYAPPGLPLLDRIALDVRVFLVLAVCTLVAAALCGLVPALRLGRVRVGDAMRAGRGTNDTPRRRQIRHALVVSEFAMTFVLLAGAGLVLRSFSAMLRVDPGFDAVNTVQMEIGLKGSSHAAVEQRAPFFAELVTRVRQAPGVQSAALTNHIPIVGDHWPFPFAIEGRPIPRAGAGPRALFRIATPGYFGTMGMTIREGRDLSDDDARSSAHVVVVNEAMARTHWPNESPIGKRLTVDGVANDAVWFTVVGIVSDVRQNKWTDVPAAEMYFPYLPGRANDSTSTLVSFLHPNQMTLVVKTSSPSAAIPAVSDVVRDMDRDAVVANASTMATIVAAQFVQPRFYLWLVGSFAVVALALAAVGIYGVISYSVAQRTRELGIRAALGANRGDSLALVIKQGLLLAGIGGMLGLIIAVVAMRFAQALLVGVEPTDPVTLAASTAVITAVAVAASYVPALKAARVDPVVALRAD